METRKESKKGPTYGNLVTILSIDGGGVRGIIPATILSYLESELQELDGEDARLADYFDVMGGTNSGGLTSILLAAPGENNRPVYTAKDIANFYKDYWPQLLPQRRGPFKILNLLRRPKYNGKAFRHLTNLLGDNRLHHTLTNLIVPSFDIKLMQPTIFSSYDLERSPWIDARLEDICIGTCAAPTYFPAHYFKNRDQNGEEREFNLVDGVVAANNPALIATSLMTNLVFGRNPNFFPINPEENCKFLVISLGTGTTKMEKKYDAKMAAKWGLLGWLLHGGSRPIVDSFIHASTNLIDFHLSAYFRGLHSQDNYLRIQDDTLNMTEFKPDNSRRKNIDKLVEIGENLLEKQVSRVDLETGLAKPIGNGCTNRVALKKFAKLLSEERKQRMAMTSDKAQK